jgi:glycosyltransferase involved in cell wall biosynthesis
VCFVGVLEPRKNLPNLIRAYLAVLEKHPTVPLAVIGKKGWHYKAVFELVRELRLEQNVRYLGYVPEEDLVGLLNGARVFVYPS